MSLLAGAVQPLQPETHYRAQLMQGVPHRLVCVPGWRGSKRAQAHEGGLHGSLVTALPARSVFAGKHLGNRTAQTQ